jgi:hypothetical protein
MVAEPCGSIMWQCDVAEPFCSVMWQSRVAASCDRAMWQGHVAGSFCIDMWQSHVAASCDIAMCGSIMWHRHMGIPIHPIPIHPNTHSRALMIKGGGGGMQCVPSRSTTTSVVYLHESLINVTVVVLIMPRTSTSHTPGSIRR